MIDKIVSTPAEALADVRDGATVMIGGFGTAGLPDELVEALIDQGARDLTVVNNNAGNGDGGQEFCGVSRQAGQPLLNNGGDALRE